MGSFHSRDESLVFELPPEFQKLSIIRLMRGCTACTVAFAAGPEPWFVRFQCEGGFKAHQPEGYWWYAESRNSRGLHKYV